MVNTQVILSSVGYRFGRFPFEGLGPTAFWPVGSRSAIEGLIGRLAEQGIEEVVVYSDCQLPLPEQKPSPHWPLRVRFVHDPEVSGSAGMLRLAVDRGFDGKIVLMPVNLVNPPAIRALLTAHEEGRAELTVFLNPGPQGTLSEIYVCEGSILGHIPEQGYWDIKERVIPELAVLKKKVHQAVLPKAVGCFYDRASYLQAISTHLEEIAPSEGRLRLLEQDQTRQIWVSGHVEIHPTARIYGILVALEGACIGEGAVVIGPTVVGRGSVLGKKSIVMGSVLWDRAGVGMGSEIQRCLMGHGAVVPSCEALEDEVVVSPIPDRAAIVSGRTGAVIEKKGSGGSMDLRSVAGPAGVAVAFLWSFWPGLRDLWGLWQRSDEYSSGLLVPFLAAYVLWCRRDQLKGIVIKICPWGAGVLVLAIGLRLWGLYDMRSSAEYLSVVLALAALVLWLAGRVFFRKVWTIMAFLLLMLPWPNRVQAAISQPLQGWSTASAVFGLELIGYDVVREGNVIHIGDTTVAVAEACNGLRMITAFFVISGLVVLLVRRSWWERLIIFVSSLPIALVCNTLRLAVTSVAFTIVKGDRWQQVFHDFGGYAMMPLALAIVVGELWMLRRLTKQPITEEKVAIIHRRSRSERS